MSVAEAASVPSATQAGIPPASASIEPSLVKFAKKNKVEVV